MDKNFLLRLDSLRDDSITYITEILKERGTGYQLIDPATYEDGIEDEVYGLPRGVYLTKHWSYSEHSIVVINIDDEGILSFEGIDTDGTTEDQIFKVEDMFTETLALIAALVYKFEN